jgi:hypothetical protein
VYFALGLCSFWKSEKGQVIFLLCHGMCLSETNNVPLFLFETKPWSCLSKTEMCPVNINFAKEVVPQARILCVHPPMPQPPDWPKSQKIEWLEANPMQDSISISFLRGKVLWLKEILQMLLVCGRAAGVIGSSWWKQWQ